MEITLKSAIDVFFLAWNMQTVILFIVFAQKVEKSRLIKQTKPANIFEHFRKAGEFFSDSLKKYEKTQLSRDLAIRILEAVETFMLKENHILRQN